MLIRLKSLTDTFLKRFIVRVVYKESDSMILLGVGRSVVSQAAKQSSRLAHGCGIRE